MTDHLSKLTLLALAAGDLAPEKKAEALSHVQGCGDCRRALEALETDREVFLKDHPFEARKIEKPGFSFFRPAYYRMAAVLALFVAAGAYFTVLREKEGTRTKGGEESVRIMVLDGDGSVAERKNPVYRPGERIQFIYSCAERNRLALMSIDSLGRTTVYYPVSGDSSVRLEQGRDLPLDRSILLDGYIGPELFVAVLSSASLPVDAVQSALEEAFRRNNGLKGMEIHVNGDAFTWTALIRKEAP